MMSKIRIVTALAILVVSFGGGFYIKNIKAENAALKLELKTSNETLNHERAHWKRISQAVTVASTVQSGICKAEMERRSLIDDISREAQTAQVPEGSIDEKTNKKVLDLFNNSLFCPLGGGLRRKVD